MRDLPKNVAEFVPETLMGFAQARTGLSDFGPQGFLEPLRVLTAAIREEAQLNAAGVHDMGERLVNALANRLRRVRLFADHPEIADQQVGMAALIVGLPRTGSTMLHRLLADSPQATAVRWWESVFPVPRTAADADVSLRQHDAEALVKGIMDSADGFDAIHPLDAYAFDEELPLIEQSFVSNMPESMMYIPSYGKWLLEYNKHASYLELIDYLKILQWQSPERRGRKWILKCPHHLIAVPTVLEMFPDATIVMTHRPVEKIIPSWCSMVGTLTGAYSDVDHNLAQADHWTSRLSRNLHDLTTARLSAESRFVDVDYQDLLNRPLEQARKVFAAAGLSVSPEDEHAWQGWLDANKRDNRPSHQYSLEQFGITRERLVKDFGFYTGYVVTAA